MATIIDKLNLIEQYKEACRRAIITKGVEVVPNTPFKDYATKILEIQTSAGATITPPRLNAVSITRNGNTITISNPSSNGSYVSSFDYYTGDFKVGNLGLSTSFDITQKYNTGTHLIGVKATNKNFFDSVMSNVEEVKVCSITNNTVGFSNPTNLGKITDGLTYSIKLTPNANAYLPDTISVYESGKLRESTFDRYTGDVTIANIQGDISIEGEVYNENTLRYPRATFDRDNKVLTIEQVKYATKIDITIDNELRHTQVFEPPAFSIEAVPNASYGFVENGEWWQNDNWHRGGTYALCRLDFEIKQTTGSLSLKFTQSSESGYDYGIISQVDKTLSLSTNDDGSSNSTNVYQNFKGKTYTTPYEVVFSNIAQGKHFIYIKYRKDGGGDNGDDRLKFQVVAVG